MTLKRSASISELTICLGNAGDMPEGWFRTLRNLNPRFDPEAQQPVVTTVYLPKALEASYASRCVDGPWPILAADLHNAVVPKPVAVAPAPAPAVSSKRARRYRVRAGDTLISIVHKLRCSSVREVAEANHLTRHQIRARPPAPVPECR